MPVFGVTGKLGSGKSTLLKLLSEKGARVYNVDRKIHQYYRDKNSRLYKKVAAVFAKALCKNKEISRKKLGEIVFADRKALSKLEKIVHPAVIKDLKLWAAANRKKRQVYIAEVPLLFEKNLQKFFDGVILVVANRETALHRIQSKFGISRKEAIRRLSLFMPDKAKKKRADFVVENNLTVKHLIREADILWRKIKEM
ncbi:MAG: dephospho-CoA kinase [Candidatus Omnitrophota bacterium]|nr:MAG: dephospho-CoA kinase [Candidatus Omnitrophota bacterium]